MTPINVQTALFIFYKNKHELSKCFNKNRCVTNLRSHGINKLKEMFAANKHEGTMCQRRGTVYSRVVDAN